MIFAGTIGKEAFCSVGISKLVKYEPGVAVTALFL